MDDVLTDSDELGPAKVVHVREPGLGLEAVLVVDNVACGPSVGGLRMASDVSTAECLRLARAMTLKNAAAGLPHGGGKSVLRGDPRMARNDKERLIRAFAHALRNEDDYIFGPDMGTDEGCMAWVKDEIGRAVGLPSALGGIPLDDIGATGWGIRHAAEVAASYCRLNLEGAPVVIQGFGAVGMHGARFLAERGAILVAASDSQGTLYDPHGLPVADLIGLKEAGKPVYAYTSSQTLDRDAVLDKECDIWIPAAHVCPGRPGAVRLVRRRGAGVLPHSPLSAKPKSPGVRSRVLVVFEAVVRWRSRGRRPPGMAGAGASHENPTAKIGSFSSVCCPTPAAIA